MDPTFLDKRRVGLDFYASEVGDLPLQLNQSTRALLPCCPSIHILFSFSLCCFSSPPPFLIASMRSIPNSIPNFGRLVEESRVDDNLMMMITSYFLAQRPRNRRNLVFLLAVSFYCFCSYYSFIGAYFFCCERIFCPYFLCFPSFSPLLHFFVSLLIFLCVQACAAIFVSEKFLFAENVCTGAWCFWLRFRF